MRFLFTLSIILTNVISSFRQKLFIHSLKKGCVYDTSRIISHQTAIILKKRLQLFPLLFSNSQSSFGDDDIRYLQTQFNNLSQQSGYIKFKTFLDSDEIQSLINDELFAQEEFAQYWIDVVGDLKSSCSFDQFVKINRLIDDEIEEDNEIDNDEERGFVIGNEMLNTNNPTATVGEVNDDDDVWSPSFDPIKYMDPEFIIYLRDYFNKYAKNELLNFTALNDWTDVKDLLSEGNIDVDILKDLWLEALQETGTKSLDKKTAFKEATINFDTFLRLNMRLNEIIEEVDNAIDSLSDEDLETYFRSEFQNLVYDYKAKDDMLSIQQVLKWNDLKQVMKDFSIEEDEVIAIWKSLKSQMPKSDVLNSSNSKGFGTKVQSSSSKSLQEPEEVMIGSYNLKFINEDEFVNFNYLLEEYLKQKVPAAPTNWDSIDFKK